MNEKKSRDSKVPVSFDESRPDFTPYGFTCELWSPRTMPRSDRHNEVEINLLHSGSLTYLFGGERWELSPGHMTLFWGALPHQILQHEAMQPYYVATLPLVWFLNCGFPDAFVGAILNGEIVADLGTNRQDEPSFRRWITDFKSCHPLRERVAQLEIQARLLRLALARLGRQNDPPRPPPLPGVDTNLSRADRLACFIAQHYTEPLDARQIAQAVGLHTNYAMTLFRRTFNATITEFLTRHRLSHAQRLLVTTREPIIDVAGDSGFQSLSRFNEVFKSACGCAPRTYRREHQVVGPPVVARRQILPVR